MRLRIRSEPISMAYANSYGPKVRHLSNVEIGRTDSECDSLDCPLILLRT